MMTTPDDRPADPDPDVLNAAQLAERLGLDRVQTVTDLAAAGEIPGKKFGREWRFWWPAIVDAMSHPVEPHGGTAPPTNDGSPGASVDQTRWDHPE